MDAKRGADAKQSVRDDKNDDKMTVNSDEELLWLCNTLEEYKEQNDEYASEIADLRDKLMRFEELEKKKKMGKGSIE